MKRLFQLFALVCAGTAASAADVYKWTDKDGIVHYSDEQPPADAKAERVPVTGMAKKPAVAGAAANDADEAATPPAAPPPVVTPTLIAQKRCEQARANLDVLKSKNAAVGLDDGTGKATPMSDQARNERIATEQRAIADYCK
jgi:hypothetical protein